MQFKTPHHVLVAGSLALILGMGLPATALAAEADGASDDNQVVEITEEDSRATVEGAVAAESLITDEEDSSVEAASVRSTAGDQADENQAAENQADGDQPAENQADGDQPADEQSAVREGATGTSDGAQDLSSQDQELQPTPQAQEEDSVPQEQKEPAVAAEEEASATTEEVPTSETVDTTPLTPQASETEPEATEAGAAETEVTKTTETGTVETEKAQETKKVDEGRTIANGTYTFSSKLKLSYVLYVAGGKKVHGANVQIYTTKGITSQRWLVRYISDGFYNILSNSKVALTVVAKNGKISKGSNVVLKNLVKGAKTQLWSFVADGSYYKIIPALNAKLALNVSGGKAKDKQNVQVWTSNNTKAQRFRAYVVKKAPVSTCELDDGTYEIRANKRQSYGLEVKDESRNNGANVQLHTANHSQVQKFYFIADGKGYYSIRVIGSGKALSTKNYSVVPGNNVIQANYTGSDIQKWSLQQTSKGIEIVNKYTGLVLDITATKYANGTNVRCYSRTNKDAQRFALQQTQALSDGIYTIYNVKDSAKVIGVVKGKVKLKKSDDSLAQRFEIIHVDGEVYRIRTGASGGYLASTGSNLVQSGVEATPVRTTNSWELVWNGGYFSLRNLKAGKVLDLKDGKTSNGTAIRVYAANESTAQHFYYTPSNLLVDGTYLMKAVCGSNAVLEVPKGKKTRGLGLQINANSSANGQQFTLKATGDATNTYVIKNATTGLAVSVKNASTATNAAVVQDKYTGAASQKWKAAIADGGCVMFVNVNSGKAITVGNGKSTTAKNGTKMRQNIAAANNRAQKLKLQPISWQVQDGKYYYYDKNGKKTTWNVSAYRSWNKIKNLTSGTKYIGAVDQDKCYTTFFINQGNAWVPVQNWLCSVGADISPTPKGIFRMNGYRNEYAPIHDGKDGIYYWTQVFKNGPYFHSVLYAGRTMRITWTHLGHHNSGGCIRCPYEKARWVYYHAYKGTTVCIF